MGSIALGRLGTAPPGWDTLGSRPVEGGKAPRRSTDVADERMSGTAATGAGGRPDPDLLRGIGRGDEDAFRQLFRRYAPRANALALRLLRQPFLAEEAVQDAFLAVWRTAGAYDPDRGSVRGWLLGMVHNRAVDLVRREESQRRRAQLAVAQQDIDDPADRVADDLGSLEEGERVRAAMAELPDEQRQVIELMYFGGLSQSQIAGRLSLPLGTVKSRTLLAMRRLRGRLVGMER
jgi:RNA polymerase sigma-70 factor (ECF subfamily)